ncbi:MAG: DUF2786 domain-containing protein [Myxococcota bacterium]
MAPGPDDARQTLSAELEAALLRRLKYEWVQINWALFGDAMRSPIFELSDSTTTLGVWRPADRTIAMSRKAVLERAWTDTVETIKHEAAHQFVHEILRVDEAPHGPNFRRTCAARGIDARAVETARGDAAAPALRVVTRVQKLLALAQSANQHEAELAASTAQRIMLKHNISLQDTARADDCGHVWLGAPTGRVQAHQRQLAALLVEHFFVEAIWIPVYRPREGKRGSVLEVCGRAENLAMAQYVHAFVLASVERLWRAHKREAGIRSDRDRRSFLAGAVAGFAQTLQAKQAEAQREGLVWVGDAQVRDYFGRRHPRTRSTGRAMSGSHEAYAEGQSAGRGLVLSRPVTSDRGAGQHGHCCWQGIRVSQMLSSGQSCRGGLHP